MAKVISTKVKTSNSTNNDGFLQKRTTNSVTILQHHFSIIHQYFTLILWDRHSVHCVEGNKPLDFATKKEEKRSHSRQPKYLSSAYYTKNAQDNQVNKAYKNHQRIKRKPGSCYRCCVPYPKPPSNHHHYTTKRPRPTHSWIPRPTRYISTLG